MGTQIEWTETQPQKIQGYYRLHARVYEQTRWTFLFGRKRILEKLNLQILNHLHLMEIGCGTGSNLVNLAEKHPNMRLSGMDISEDMLEIARENTRVFEHKLNIYNENFAQKKRPNTLPKADILLFSYCLTMINPGWENAIEHASNSLLADGRIAVVDFHSTRFAWFERWMRFNHVRMNGHLMPILEEKFEKMYYKKVKVYGGLWSYFIFIGKLKKHQPQNGY
jgi:S-adenosylmethionine-diacylgycerolhomoserine-N-methlytransferase